MKYLFIIFLPCFNLFAQSSKSIKTKPQIVYDIQLDKNKFIIKSTDFLTTWEYKKELFNWEKVTIKTPKITSGYSFVYSCLESNSYLLNQFNKITASWHDDTKLLLVSIDCLPNTYIVAILNDCIGPPSGCSELYVLDLQKEKILSHHYSRDGNLFFVRNIRFNETGDRILYNENESLGYGYLDLATDSLVSIGRLGYLETADAIYSPNSKYIAYSIADEVKVMNSNTNSEYLLLPTKNDTIRYLSFNQAGDELIGVSSKMIYKWDIFSGNRIHLQEIDALTMNSKHYAKNIKYKISPNDKFLLTLNEDKIEIHEISTGNKMGIYYPHIKNGEHEWMFTTSNGSIEYSKGLEDNSIFNGNSFVKKTVPSFFDLIFEK